MTPDLAELTDPALVAAVRNGDSNAFKTLYRRHRSAVRRTVSGVLHDPDRIDDTVQETFLRVLERIGEIREPASVSAFVTGIAHDTALEVAHSVVAHPDAPGSMLEELAEVRELVTLVSGVLADLAPGDAQALAMAGYLDSSAAEIGRELDISPAAADAALRRARRRLRTGVKLEVLVRSNAGGCLEFTVLTKDADYPAAARHLATCERCQRAGHVATQLTSAAATGEPRVPTLTLDVTGPAGASRVPLVDTLYVGRECAGIDPQHRLLVTDPSVSRVHLELQITSGTARVSATDRSRNGTRLNGAEMQRGAPLYLLDGDVLTMGDTQLTLRVDAADATGAAPPEVAPRSRPATVTIIGLPLARTAVGRADGPVPADLPDRLASAAELFGGVADEVPGAVLLVRWVATGAPAEVERQCAHFLDFAKLLADNAGVRIEWDTNRA